MTEWTCVAERAGVAAWQMGNQTAPLVVMVHGMEDTWNSFERMARIMTAEGRCRTIAFDLPWRSGADPTWFDEAGPVEWLRSALELVDGPIECVIGHSFGCLLYTSDAADE